MSDGYFGACPICRNDGIVLNIHRNHWMMCPTHSVCWSIGSNLFSGWKEETEDDWARNCRVLEGCQVVEPWYPGPAKLTTTENAKFALAVANSRELLRRALTVFSNAVEFLEVADPSQITPNEFSRQLLMRTKPIEEALSEAVATLAHFDRPEFEDGFDQACAAPPDDPDREGQPW